MTFKRITVEHAAELLRQGTYTVFFFNDCYGGGLPDLRSDLVSQVPADASDTERQVHMLKLIASVGPRNASSVEYTAFGVAVIPRFVEDFVSRSEYDGLEKPYFQRNEYRLARIREILAEKPGLTREEFEDVCKVADSVRCRCFVVDFKAAGGTNSSS